MNHSEYSYINKMNLKKVQVDIRSNGVIENIFETLPQITVPSRAVLPTVLDS